MTAWLVWAFVLMAQNAAFTLVSRARNSRSLSYHSVASLLSNGVWFASLGFAFDKLGEARRSGSWELLVVTAVFYTVFTTLGSVGMHHLLMTRVETGKRRIEIING